MTATLTTGWKQKLTGIKKQIKRKWENRKWLIILRVELKEAGKFLCLWYLPASQYITDQFLYDAVVADNPNDSVQWIKVLLKFPLPF